MGNEPVHPVVSPFPPVLRRAVVQQERGPFLEGELPWRAPNVVKLGYGFNLLHLCTGERHSESSSAQLSPKGRLNPREPSAEQQSSAAVTQRPRAAHTEHKPARFQTDQFLLLLQAPWDLSQTHKLLAITNSYKADGEQQESPSVHMAPSPTLVIETHYPPACDFVKPCQML